MLPEAGLADPQVREAGYLTLSAETIADYVAQDVPKDEAVVMAVLLDFGPGQ